MKEKKKGWKDKKEDGGGIRHDSFWRNWLWRRAQWAYEGFSWKRIRHLGFGSETTCPSRGILDSAVKLSALAGRIGESIQGSHLQTLASWFDYLHQRKEFSYSLVRQGIPPLGRVDSWSVFFSVEARERVVAGRFLSGGMCLTLQARNAGLEAAVTPISDNRTVNA